MCYPCRNCGQCESSEEGRSIRCPRCGGAVAPDRGVCDACGWRLPKAPAFSAPGQGAGTPAPGVASRG
ncbi:MAG: hypothetical protein HFJ75_01870 [Eggerthellaceae bacterium]|nr:hypothetical protein [Eggerthellaceae bacterium]